ncbi:MAG: NUDIX hydrolase [Candidatus Aenigmarchaeota archaeon]|nr:NUDIX hydrolase [Candidatus Aenigmarchaeota archaeon]MBU5689097.1 NUDIX hydrolase [Candidatus Aenigmarchaeota archaeon]
MTDSVQAVIFNEEKEILIIKRKGYHDDKFLWRLVKGRKNNNENDEDALKREIEEETGLKKFQILDKIYNYSYITPENKIVNVNTFLVFANKNQKLSKIDQEEQIIDYKWVKFDKAEKMLFFNDEKIALNKAKKFLNHSPLS